MLNVNISDDDHVLVVMPVDMAHTVVHGSTHVRCAECGADCWLAPAGMPYWKPGRVGYELREGVVPEPNIYLCIRCAEIHYQFLT